MKNAKTSSLSHFLSKKIGRAISEFNLLQDNDRILVGISGGKDSLTLFSMLWERKKWIPIKYELVPLYVDFGFIKQDALFALQQFFQSYGCPLIIEKRAFSQDPSHKKDKYCFFCAWSRRRVLFEMAEHFQCNKIALGHHLDDVVQTAMLNMFFHGELSTMVPCQSVFKGKFHIIRPLFYLEGHEIARFAQYHQFPIAECTCTRKDTNKRVLMEQMIEQIRTIYPGVKTTVLASLRRIKKDYLPPQVEKK